MQNEPDCIDLGFGEDLAVFKRTPRKTWLKREPAPTSHSNFQFPYQKLANVNIAHTSFVDGWQIEKGVSILRRTMRGVQASGEGERAPRSLC